MLWTRRDTRPTGRLADVVLVVFHEGALSELPMSLSAFGAPSADAVARVDVTAIQDRAWLDGWRSGSIRNIAEQQLGASLAALDLAHRCHLVRATVLDPFELGYLQGAWAIARWLVARGASTVLDAHAIRFHSAAAVQGRDPAGPLDVAHETSVIFETEPETTRLGHVVHTRGMIKFARPDLIALVPPARAQATGALLGKLAIALADGFMPTPGARPPPETMIAEAVTLRPDDSLAEALHLNNDAQLVEIDAAAS